MKYLLPLLLFFLPIQKAIWKPFHSLSRSWIPEGVAIPHFFYKQIFFFPSDGLILLLFGLGLYHARKHLFAFFFQGEAKYLFFFFVTALLSTLFSPFHQYKLQYFRLLQLFLFFFLFCTVKAYFAKSDREKIFKTLSVSLLLAALLQSGIAFFQFFTHSPIGLKCLGEQNLHSFTFFIPGSHTLFFRASGLFSHPNVLGAFLCLSLMATAYLFLIESARVRKLLLSFSFFIQLAALVLTFSRSAIFAYFLSLLIFCTCALYTRTLRWKQIYPLLTPIACSLFFCCIAFYPHLKNRGGILNYNQISLLSDTQRLIYQNMALEMCKTSPLLGIGFNNFELLSSQYAPKDYSLPLETKVHNIFLLILTETGLIGLICFLLFFFFLLKKRETTLVFLFLYTLAICFIGLGMCDFYFLETQQGKILFFAVTGLLAGTQSFSAEVPVRIFAKKRIS